MPRHNAIDYPTGAIRLWIQEGQTQQQIADRLRKTLDQRITAKLIYKVCRKCDIVCRRTGPRSGEGHPEWKGGRVVTKAGYVKLWCPEHPTCVRTNERRAARANGKYFPKAKYVWEHRLVMEKSIGRFLSSKEVVHHLNGVTSDNHLENLVLFGSNAEHLKVDLAGRCPKWTAEGKARILAAVQKRVARDRLRKKHGVCQPQQNSAPLKD